MTVIRTTCPRCGEVDMGPEEILLSALSVSTEARYQFTCPVCFDLVEKRADQKIVNLLERAGVKVRRGRPEGASDDSVVSMDDAVYLAEFCLDLVHKTDEEMWQELEGA